MGELHEHMRFMKLQATCDPRTILTEVKGYSTKGGKSSNDPHYIKRYIMPKRAVKKPALKRFATAVALTATMSLSVPQWVSGDWKDLSELQKEVLTYKAGAKAYPEDAFEMFYDWGTFMGMELKLNSKDLNVFANCIGDRYLWFFENVSPSEVVSLSDTELKAYLGDASFDFGIECARELED